MKTYIITIIIGLVSGIMGGLVGIGGATVMIPLLVLVLGFTQHTAQGTALAAMIPPIGLLAAYEYYKSGYMDMRAALLIAAGFIVGGLIGAKMAVKIDSQALTKIFGVVLFIISLKMIFK